MCVFPRFSVYPFIRFSLVGSCRSRPTPCLFGTSTRPSNIPGVFRVCLIYTRYHRRAVGSELQTPQSRKNYTIERRDFCTNRENYTAIFLNFCCACFLHTPALSGLLKIRFWRLETNFRALLGMQYGRDLPIGR